MNFCVAILTLNMGENTQHFRHIMLHYFKKDKNTTEMKKKICAVCVEGTVTNRTHQKQFAKFHVGDFSLDYAPWLGKPIEVDSNQIETLIMNNQCYTTWEIADILKISTPITNKILVKMKNVPFVLWVKKHMEFLANPLHLLLSRNVRFPNMFPC